MGGCDAIYYRRGQPEAEVLEAVQQVAGRAAVSPRFFCAWGGRHQPSVCFDDPAHHLVPPGGCAEAFVPKGSIPLPRSGALGAFLAVLSSRIGSGRVHVETIASCSASRRWVNAADLSLLLPGSAIVATAVPCWVTVRRTPTAGGSVLSAYAALAEDWESWDHGLTQASGAWWLTQLQRALADRGVLERAGLITGPPGSMLDVGGGIGFFATELAHLGWDATVLDPSDYPERTLQLLRRLAGVTGALRWAKGRMEEMDFDDGRFSLVCFMGCLLLAPRERAREVLARAMRFLRPGGHLVIRENLRQGGAWVLCGRNGPDSRFRPADFLDIVRTAGEPLFYDHHGIPFPHQALTDRRVVYAVIRKAH